VAIFTVIIALLAVALLFGGRSNPPVTTSARPPAIAKRAKPHARAPARAVPTRVTLQLRPTAPVYVCLLGSGGRKLINGVIITPGRPQPVYRSTRFEITLGNSSLSMRVNGHIHTVAPSTNAFGFSITPRAQRSLPAARLPSCR
jgi:hypothetical protein